MSRERYGLLFFNADRLVRQYSALGVEAPRRGAFFVARWSEGRSPDDPGLSMPSLIILDPARGRS